MATQNKISLWINLNGKELKEHPDQSEEVTAASLKKKFNDNGDTIVVHNGRVLLSDKETIPVSDIREDNPVYIFKEITVRVSYKILLKENMKRVTVAGNAKVKDLFKALFGVADRFMTHVSVKYDGEEVSHDAFVYITGLEEIYVLSRSEIKLASRKIDIMASLTSTPTTKGNLLKKPKKRLGLSFLVPICDHQEGRVGDDVTLYYPGFQKFIDNTGKMKPDDDALLAHEMCREMSQIFSKELDRQKKFAEILTKFFKFNITLSETGQSVADLMIDPCQCVQVEVKNEMCSSSIDSYSQVIAYYIQSLKVDTSKLNLQHKHPLKCPAPGYLLELVGPHLFISGAVFGEYVFVDRLIDPVWLVPQNEKAMIRIGRIFQALKYAIEEIQRYYRPIKQEDIHRAQPRYPVFKSFNEGKCRITYKLRIKRHVFKGHLECDDKEPVDVIIKFTKRYCSDAHDLMFRKGFAPKLIHSQEVEGTEYTVVVLKHIPDAIPLKEYYPRNINPDPYKEILKKMHDEGYCHGKLTPNNILIQLKDGNEFIYIVDYKWAGRIREAKYPFSADIPDGVIPGDLITREQDEEQLIKVLDSCI